jgi:hypothetical protein
MPKENNKLLIKAMLRDEKADIGFLIKHVIPTYACISCIIVRTETKLLRSLDHLIVNQFFCITSTEWHCMSQSAM